MHRGPARRGLVLTTMCVGMFLVLLDVTIVNVALADIRRDLAVHAAGLEWVVDADTLGFATLMLTAGALGDAFGRRRLAVSGLLVFGAGSVVCGAALGLSMLLTGRALQGIGGALLLPQTLAVIAREYPEPAEQARAFGIWAGVSSLALPAGPLLGGVLVDRFGWPSVFLVNVPVVAVAAAATLWLVHDDRRRARHGLDARGQVLAIVTVGGWTVGVVEAARLGWSSPVVIGALVIGALALVVFVHVERHARDPMLPLHWFRRRAFAAPNAVGLLMNFGGVGMLYLVTLLLQVVERRSELAAGVWLVAFTAPLALLAPVAGRVSARFGTRLPMVAGMTLAAAGVCLFLPAGGHGRGDGLLLTGMALAGTGLALNTAPMVAAVMRALPEERGAFASAVNNTARQVGAALGVAALGGIAGDPGAPSFVRGVHVAAGVTALAWVGAAAVAAVSVDPRRAAPARASERVRSAA